MDMFENIKDGDLVTLKLASGEEVIANFKTGTDSYISIEKALVLMQGPQGLAFGTFSPLPSKINLSIYQKTRSRL